VLLVEQRRGERSRPIGGARWGGRSVLACHRRGDAEATHRFCLLGTPTRRPAPAEDRANQVRADFLRDIVGAGPVSALHDLPIFKDEVMIDGRADATMRLTTYRMILTSPYGQTLCLP